VSHVSLALKYRPRRFEDLLGQDVLARTLSELIKRGQIVKNLVISGPYGSGKTSSARIYGRALNCVEPTPTGSPCMTCDNCRMLDDDGRGFPDYMEFDGASHGTKDEIKNILEICRQPPMYGKTRVMVCDEAQGVSKQGFDAMLKIVEEPPPFLGIVFTTTEKNKIRPAVLSRCLQGEVKLLEPSVSVAHLAHICAEENIAFESSALELIAYLAEGHPRDLLKRLEQVADLGDVTLESVKQSFSLGYTQVLVNYSYALLNNDPLQQAEILRNWDELPATKLELIRQYFLFVYYTEFLRAQFTVNPVFSFIPQGDRQAVLNAFADRAHAGNYTLDEVWNRVNDFWARATIPQSDVALNYLLLHFHHFLNTNNLVSDALPRTKSNSGPTVGTPTKGRTSRPFAQGVFEEMQKQKAGAPAPAVPTPPPTPPAVTIECTPPPNRPDPRFAHNLPHFGFRAAEPATHFVTQEASRDTNNN
jgi:DNA polymerase III subunit gamma/tau